MIYFQNSDAKKCSKLEITLKSSTLPRPRKMSKAEIILSGEKVLDKNNDFRIENKINSSLQNNNFTTNSDVQCIKSYRPVIKNSPPIQQHIIPIQREPDLQKGSNHSTTMLIEPHQEKYFHLTHFETTVNSKLNDVINPMIRSELIRKSPREYIIPIALESEGYVSPKLNEVSMRKNSKSTNSRHRKQDSYKLFSSDTRTDEKSFSSWSRYYSHSAFEKFIYK